MSQRFGSSGGFCSGNKGHKPHWTVRCWAWVLFTRFFFHSLKDGFRIHPLRHTWPCMIVNILATQVAKFLELSGYCTVIKYAFIFYSKNGSCHFHYVACLSVQLSNHWLSQAMLNMSVYQLPQYYCQQWVQLMVRIACSKILQNLTQFISSHLWNVKDMILIYKAYIYI